MQKDLAMVLLGVIGKTLGERGVITPEEMPHAIDRLKRAIKDDTHQAHIHVAELTAKDDEDGEISYQFNMAILEMDLPPLPASRGG